jgi:hypothetical protein
MQPNEQGAASRLFFLAIWCLLLSRYFAGTRRAAGGLMPLPTEITALTGSTHNCMQDTLYIASAS